MLGKVKGSSRVNDMNDNFKLFKDRILKQLINIRQKVLWINIKIFNGIGEVMCILIVNKRSYVGS